MTTDPLGYYADLGVGHTASVDEIKTVYRALAKIYHPDVNKDKAAADKFRRLTEAYKILGDSEKRSAYDRHTTASREEQKESKSPSERERVEPVECSKCGKITAQPRFLVFRQVVSFIVLTRVSPRPGIFCSDCAAKQAFRSSAVSAAFGWWGFPWGPIHTVREILRNAFGGERHTKVDEQLIWQNVVAFMDANRYDLAASLAAQLTTAVDTKIAKAAQQLLESLAGKRQMPRRLRSSWKMNMQGAVGQVLMGSAIPAIAYLLLVDPLEFNQHGSGYEMPPESPTGKSLDLSERIAPSVAPVENKCSFRPGNGQVLEQNIRMVGGHRLTIKNGSSSDAIIKLREATLGRLVSSFYVSENMTASLDGIPDGGYRVQFAYGDAMTRDCNSFIDPSASAFNDVQTFRTETTSIQSITQELTFTLYSVPGGNVRPIGISVEEFNES